MFGINDNQEDSLILNKTALDRGLFRSTSLKKYISTIQKNQSTSQNDQFLKPDPSKVDRRPGFYDKLNDKGYAPEETQIVNGDIIIGKMTPNTITNPEDKAFKDNSEMYKSHIPGVIDKVYTDIYNHEGYEMRKTRVRSERVPHIGDKLCCYDPKHDVLTTDGWIPVADVTKNHKVATLQGDVLKYMHPTEIQQYDYNGNMYELKSNQIDLCVTPNHRMYVGNREGKNFNVKLAEECYGKRWSYKKNVSNHEFTGEPSGFINYNNNTFVLPASDIKPKLELNLEAWLKFFGIWLAEGCMLREYAVSFATHKDRVKDELERVCPILGFVPRKHKDKKDDTKRNAWVYPDDKRLTTYISSLFNNDEEKTAIYKKLPEWVWELKQNECRTLINGMMLGDGHTMENGTRRYDTSSIKLADGFQRLCLHAGYSTNISIKCKKGYTAVKKDGKPITTTTDAYRMTIIETQNTPLVNKNIKPNGDNRHDKLVPYNGKVYCCTVPGQGIIYVRRNGVPTWCGQSRHGQKGTVGICLPAYDMPISERGIVPDMIVNPNALPKRMTVGQFIECLTEKVAAVHGHEIDGTAFGNVDMDALGKRLEEEGFRADCTEELYNGMTGKKMKVKIFMGPTYYYRLKHLVSDKIHSRARGPRTLLTRQAPEGRSRDGGLRIGEMERDTIISHGMAKFLKERMLETADIYTTHVCNICGLFAQRQLKKDQESYPTKDDIYWCPMCRNKTDISKIMIPYAFKLLLQELMAMCIAPRIRIRRDKFNTTT